MTQDALRTWPTLGDTDATPSNWNQPIITEIEAKRVEKPLILHQKVEAVYSFFVYFLETQARNEGCARKMTIRRRKCVMETDTRETEMGIDISASVLSQRECKVVKLDVSKPTPREHNDIEAQT